MTTKATKAANRVQAIATLCDLCPPDTTIWAILRSVAKSGMSRKIDFYTFKVLDTGQIDRVYLTGYIAKVLEYPRDKSGALVVRGGGMDVGYHVVHNLSYALHGMPTEKHAACGDDLNKPRAGYTLRFDWL